jgi:hypothetical protein
MPNLSLPRGSPVVLSLSSRKRSTLDSALERFAASPFTPDTLPASLPEQAYLVPTQARRKPDAAACGVGFKIGLCESLCKRRRDALLSQRIVLSRAKVPTALARGKAAGAKEWLQDASTPSCDFFHTRLEFTGEAAQLASAKVTAPVAAWLLSYPTSHHQRQARQRTASTIGMMRPRTIRPKSQ